MADGVSEAVPVPAVVAGAPVVDSLVVAEAGLDDVAVLAGAELEEPCAGCVAL